MKKPALDIIIRDASPDDAKAVIEILNPIIEAGIFSVFDTTFSVEDERAYIINMHPRGIFHVAELTGSKNMIGIQTIEPYVTYTHAMDHVAQIGTFIKLGYEGKGTGKKLSEVTFEKARQLGYEKIFTYVRKDNQQSLDFHLKLGFRIIGTAKRQAKIKGKYIDEIIIEKFL